jgi:hypothetical protein
MKTARAAGLPAVALVAALPALGCSGNAGGFGQSTPSDSQLPADGGGHEYDASAFTGGDAGGAPGQFGVVEPEASADLVTTCQPGVYQGKFMTFVGTGLDGGSPGLFSVSWNGNLTIDLQAKTVTISSGAGVGENSGTDTNLLEIAEGGALEGGDMYGGSFHANLDGDLDCDPEAGLPYHLTATLSNGTYSIYGNSLVLGGHLTADYQASTPPTLVNGQILVDSPDSGLLSNTSAGGTWTATWVSQ